MGEFDDLSAAAKAMLPSGLRDIGGKSALGIDQEMIDACDEAAEYTDAVVRSVVELAENIRLNNQEDGFSAAWAGLIMLTKKFPPIRDGGDVLLAYLVTKTAWGSDG